MKKILIIILFSIGYHAFSQSEWAPIGAKWYFNRPYPSINDFVVFESLKDSTIAGKKVRVIDVKLNGATTVSWEYIYQHKDSIFYYNQNYKNFFLLYNFSAKIGDTITVHPIKFKPTKAFFSNYDSIVDFRYKIVSIDSIQISGKYIRRQEVALLKNGLWGFSRRDGNIYYILDKVGSLAYFFGIKSGFYLEEKLPVCRCYHEPGFEFKNTVWNRNCDDITAVNAAEALYDDVIIYSNPFTDQFSIRATEPIETVEIFDLNGMKLKVVKPNSESVVVKPAFFIKKGCFILRITTRHHIYSKKIIKN